MTGLDSVLNADDRAIGAGDGAFDEDEVLIVINAVDFEVLNGNASVAITTGHFAVLHNAARCSGCTDGATVTHIFVGTVGAFCAVEVMTFHNTSGTGTFACADDVNDFASNEHIGAEFLTDFVFVEISGVHTNFVDGFAGFNASSFEHAEFRLVHFVHGFAVNFCAADIAVAENEGIVAIFAISSFFANDGAGADLDNCHGNAIAVSGEDLCHAKFTTINSFCHLHFLRGPKLEIIEPPSHCPAFCRKLMFMSSEPTPCRPPKKTARILRLIPHLGKRYLPCKYALCAALLHTRGSHVYPPALPG